ncbi:hypothetical protein MYX76_03675 [Desulfobacterota bacterium AH_259_B03_O07]|nr:hypothetical protein [Desulfobacterota bacterium AH_259_B03_O07]
MCGGGHFRDTLRNYLNSGGDLYIKSNVTFQDVINEAKKFLYVTSDTEYAFKLALASTVGNYFDDDPTWLLVVAPPSSAKTEIIISIGGSPFAWNISSFTSKTLASGDKNSKNASLLSRIGGFGLIFLKDLTTILELHPTERGEIFSQLREIYDGRFFKTFGNGVVIDWKGKIGVIGACTPIIEKYGEIFKVLGERFLICRINDISEENEDLAIDKALSDQSDSIHFARDCLQNSVDELLKDCLYDALNEKIELSDENLNMIKVCSKFISYTRAIVVRDSYNREEILVKPFKESSMRLAKQLKSLVKGLCLIDNVNIPTNDHINILFRVALDNIPSIKREIIEAVPEEGIYATDLARKLGYSEESRYFRRIIEDLSMLRILERKKESNRVTIFQSDVIRNFYTKCSSLQNTATEEESAIGETSKEEENHNLSTEQTKIDQIRDTPYGPQFKIETPDENGKPIIQIITSESDNYEEIKNLYEEQNRS